MDARSAEAWSPLTVPNPAHSQFIPRPSYDPAKETKALGVNRARQLMNQPATESLLDYRDRAIIKF